MLRFVLGLVPVLAFLGFAPAPAAAQKVDEILSTTVRLRTVAHPDARSARTLGRERQGSGVLIDQSGLVLTVNYLTTEVIDVEVTTADGRTRAAQLVGDDPDTGFSLVRMFDPPKVRAASLGSSAAVKEGDPVMVAPGGGRERAMPASVVSRRTFAGSWEYLVENAIYTSPPSPEWSGAPLFDTAGRLVGIGSLFLNDTRGVGMRSPGNMFIPIDLLKPILGDLIAEGRSGDPATPWLGMSTEEVNGRLVVVRVTPGGPAEKVGVVAGDVVLTVGEAKPANLIELWRTIRNRGEAGVDVPITFQHGPQTKQIAIPSVDRRAWQRLRTTF